LDCKSAYLREWRRLRKLRAAFIAILRLRKPEWLAPESPPARPGWYPVTCCWDHEEGSLPGGEFWDGTRWSSGAVIDYFPEVFETQAEARNAAQERDPLSV